jgi:hypothetical protein
MSLIPQYKYDFELTSKRKIFLWMYHVIPNIDIIKKIYLLKEEQELYETKLYYGVLPNNIIIIGRLSHHINNAIAIQSLLDILYVNRLLIKYIIEPGFICSFNNNNLVKEITEMLSIYSWQYIVTDINFNPPLKEKIKCINLIFENEPYLVEEIIARLNNLYYHYQNNDICRIGIDQNNKYYLPVI